MGTTDETRRLPPRLLALTSGRARSSRDAERLAASVISLAAHGLEGCLVREPGLEDAALLTLAERLRGELEGFWLGIHDRLHVGLAVRADGVHLGFRSLKPHVARQALVQAGGAGIALGLSTHAGEDRSPWSEADYIFHGPVYPTPSKVGLVEPVGPEGVRQAASEHPAVWALGGLGADNIESAFEAGARGVAVLGALAGAARPSEVLMDLVSRLP